MNTKPVTMNSNSKPVIINGTNTTSNQKSRISTSNHEIANTSNSKGDINGQNTQSIHNSNSARQNPNYNDCSPVPMNQNDNVQIQSSDTTSMEIQTQLQNELKKFVRLIAWLGPILGIPVNTLDEAWNHLGRNQTIPSDLITPTIVQRVLVLERQMNTPAISQQQFEELRAENQT